MIEKEKITKDLQKCGYPNWAIKKGQKWITVILKKTERDVKTWWFFHMLRVWVKNLLGCTKKHDVQLVSKPKVTIKKLLVHPKDQIKSSDKCGVVYSITCNDCKGVYVGETGRALKVRLAEHKKSVTDKDKRSVVGEYL